MKQLGETPKADTLFVASVGKALRVLHCFEQARADMSLTELMEVSGLDKSSMQRFTHTLVQEGYLHKDPRSRRYRLGTRVLDLSFQFLRTNTLVEAINPLLIDLARKTGEKISLSLLDDTTLVYVLRHHLNTQYYFSSLIGRRLPLAASSGGRAMLAAMDDAAVGALLARMPFHSYTSHTLMDSQAVWQDIASIRQQGYSLGVEQIEYGEIALAAAITDRERRPIGAIHMSGVLQQWEPQQYEREFASLLQQAAQQASRI